MRISRVVLILAFATLPAASHAQPWADAYHEGDYETAAALLQPIVADTLRLDAVGDPEPVKQLATMYAEGRGVTADPILACALASTAAMAVRMEPPRQQAIGDHDARVNQGSQFEQQHCGGLSADQRQIAARAVACYAFGVPDTVLMAGPHAVRVSRGGLMLESQPDAEPVQWLCAAAVAARAISVPPPADAAPGVEARHFVEFFAWRQASLPDGSTSYGLFWEPYEVSTRGIRHPEQLVQLVVADDLPAPHLTSLIRERPSMNMIRSGHIRWMLDRTPPQRGWIMRQDEGTP